ncbi:MAG: metallophosphoesterase [Armatimonadia bacterium]
MPKLLLPLLALTLALSASAQTEPFAFVVLADPHLREDRPGEPTGVDKFLEVLAQIRALPQQPDFILMLGDTHPEKLAPLLPQIGLPVHVVAGNHETVAHRQQLRALFPGDFGDRDFYAFTHKGCRFIGLCTALVGDHVGHFESQDITPPVGQVEFLKDELATHRDLPRFIFAHVPPEPQNRPHSSHLGSLESAWFHDLVRAEKPTACFFGHRHYRYEYDCGGTPILFVPSTNWNSGAHKRGFYLATMADSKCTLTFHETPPASPGGAEL